MEALLSPQQVFDYVVGFIIRQGAPSIYRSEEGIVCRYRSADGKKCAVGCLIADRFYNEIIENYPSYNPLVMDRIEYLSDEGFCQLLRDLQIVHDEAASLTNDFVNTFRYDARYVAERHGLNWMWGS